LAGIRNSNNAGKGGAIIYGYGDRLKCVSVVAWGILPWTWKALYTTTKKVEKRKNAGVDKG